MAAGRRWNIEIFKKTGGKLCLCIRNENELARMLPEKKCCMLADIAGFMRLAGSIRLVGGGRFEIVMMTSNLAVVRHYKNFDQKLFFGRYRDRSGAGKYPGEKAATIFFPSDRRTAVNRS